MNDAAKLTQARQALEEIQHARAALAKAEQALAKMFAPAPAEHKTTTDRILDDAFAMARLIHGVPDPRVTHDKNINRDPSLEADAEEISEETAHG